MASRSAIKDKIYISQASIQPNAIHFFSRPVNGYDYGSRHYANRVNLEDNDTAGQMSYKARKRIQSAIMFLLFKAKPKTTRCHLSGKQFKFLVNFITLTLPAKQVHSDNEIKRVVMANFLAVMRKQYNLQNYVWRAEAQYNGNIHFHLVTDKYIHYTDLRRIWNNSCELLGYITAFEQKWHHRNAPTEQVKAVKHIRNVASYMAKYMAKTRSFCKIGELRLIKGKQVEVLYGSEQYRLEESGKKNGKVIGSIISGPLRKIEGKLWFLSRSLSNCKPIQIGQDEYSFADVEELVKQAQCRMYKGDYVCSYFGKFVTQAKKMKSPLVDRFNDSWQ